jgi:malonyl-CoA/methylmalonyl-CoA synthetase
MSISILKGPAQFGSTIFTHSYQGGTYPEVWKRSTEIASGLLQDHHDLHGERIGLQAAAGPEHLAALWGIWRAGGCVVPLSNAAKGTELAYTFSDAGVSRILCDETAYSDLCHKTGAGGLKILLIGELDSTDRPLPEVSADQEALLLYTSGTTSKPKGVPHTHATLQAQISSQGEAWQWSAQDRIPLFLPLHHVHGLINILCCAFAHGAQADPLPGFDLETVCERVAENAYTLFMAVPTVYVKLIEHLDTLTEVKRKPICEGFGNMRLMVSGSAACPVSVHDAWTRLTGQTLLERYGMTEIGMALSNPYEGERRPGTVGQPLPGVEIRLITEDGTEAAEDGVPGEIQIKGPGVFSGYLNRPEATAESFTDGWFKSGDIAQLEDGYVRILGRSSVDIIKSGGYKLSALEIETLLLNHPDIREIAVVGVQDDTWGETVAAAVVLKEGSPATDTTLREWCKQEMSVYKIPRKWLLVEKLPRNAMGKVQKPAVSQLF